MMHAGWGLGHLDQLNLPSQATPQQDTARGGGPVSRGEAEGETSKHGC